MATELFIILVASCAHATLAQRGAEMLKGLENSGRHFFSYSPEEKQRDNDLKWQEGIVSGDTLSFRPWKQASGRNVTIASMFIGESAKSWASVQRNHVTFARKFGYNYFAPFGTKNFVYGAFNRANRHPTWSKMAIIQSLFDQGSDAVFWMDGDSLFMNGQDNIDKFVKMNKDLVFSGDQNVMFNAGHFLIRKSQWSQWFMREAYSICPAPGMWMDNSAMLVMLAGGSPREPAHWPEVLQSGMKNCTSALQSSKQCLPSIAKGVKQHVRNLEQDAMNSYTSTATIFRSPQAQRPFIVHRVFTRKDERSRDLPKLASLAQCALEEMSERECQAALDGVDVEQEDETSQGQHRQEHEEEDDEEAEDEGTTSFESDLSDDSESEKNDAEEKKGAGLRGADSQRQVPIAKKVSKVEQGSGGAATQKSAQPRKTKKEKVLNHEEEEDWEELHKGIKSATKDLHKAMGYRSFIHTSWDILDHTC